MSGENLMGQTFRSEKLRRGKIPTGDKPHTCGRPTRVGYCDDNREYPSGLRPRLVTHVAFQRSYVTSCIYCICTYKVLSENSEDDITVHVKYTIWEKEIDEKENW